MGKSKPDLQEMASGSFEVNCAAREITYIVKSVCESIIITSPRHTQADGYNYYQRHVS
jgi:hypothetical protein